MTGTYSIASGRSVFTLLADGAAADPDREFLVFEDLDGNVARWSWSATLEQTNRTASFLTERGVGRGTRVHVHLSNRPEFLFVWFACARIGASIVPTNPQSSAAELEFVMSHAGVGLSITERANAPALAAVSGRLKRQVPVIDCDEVRLDAPEPLSDPPVVEDELAVMYTSGTTARPKGVRITHANYVFAGETVAKALGLRRDDRFLVVLPLFHANAQYYATLGTLIAGGTLILLCRFSASGYLPAAARHRATAGSLFAAPVRMILATPAAGAWRQGSLRFVLFAQNLTEDELAAWDARGGPPLIQIYGMTETIGPPLMNPLAGGRRDSIGRPALGYRVAVVREDGSPAGPGEQGELLVGGEPGVSLMAGYLDDPAATAAVLEDGWLRTGDIVRVAADGLFEFVDRSKDMIKRAGENVAAQEVEGVLLAHPRVSDAAVVGVPDPIRDEQIVAHVVLDPAFDRAEAPSVLASWCADRLASFRVPSYFIVRDELPRTAVGKIQKGQLRAEWREPHDEPAVAR